ncbi:SagB-type dehydrogenase domain-containing protein [Natronobacterium gregoryi]|uniref:Dehydrogenase n=2 Tax=Natronobacterium gregoryi TaxID=44930 RepID=L0AET7_NATGS|nr:SagB-type dehydrogenase domain protein [Natronobacterium gregoryi SP2]ELY62554.1 SagB-type dehydrogenase domain-containing protein [Natronobacterium gregoryi SP2]PLK20726.1 dehydrogenase [Natronobacterium gregoryi SP2]SFJ13046.1 SagB-type dehydrogenase domain-containing protein [Natronobacterium gregoryi]
MDCCTDVPARPQERGRAGTDFQQTVSQLLWASQGIIHVEDGVKLRAAPSAGGTHPLVVYLEFSSGGCPAPKAGLYRYEPAEHALESARDASIRDNPTRAALDQAVADEAPATVVLAADDERTRRQYPGHGERYGHMEAGHVAENVHRLCESWTLNSCPVSAFADAELADVLSLSAALEPLYLVSFGNRSEER